MIDASYVFYHLVAKSKGTLLYCVPFRSSQSSELLNPSWEAGGSESTSELIKLGDTAYLFSLRNEASAKSAQLSQEQLSSSAKKLGDPIRPAIALQPPYQPSVSGVSYLAERKNDTGDQDSPPPLLPLKSQEPPSTVLAEPPERESPVFSDGIRSFPDATSCKNRPLKCFFIYIKVTFFATLNYY
ncbi:hypothetical protein Chor_012287 [Crotalus horridus]